MEKFGVANDDLVNSLRDEEANLMQKMAGFMTPGEKTAEHEGEIRRAESRLQQVRAKISEIDLGKDQ